MTDTFLRLHRRDVFFRVAYHAARTQHDALKAPPLDWVRGECPKCGSPVICTLYAPDRGAQKSMGFILVYECWQAFGSMPRCDYADLPFPWLEPEEKELKGGDEDGRSCCRTNCSLSKKE